MVGRSDRRSFSPACARNRNKVDPRRQERRLFTRGVNWLATQASTPACLTVWTLGGGTLAKRLGSRGVELPRYYSRFDDRRRHEAVSVSAVAEWDRQQEPSTMPAHGVAGGEERTRCTSGGDSHDAGR